MPDRCNECGLWNISKTADCPTCGDIMDLHIDGLCLSWSCRLCGFSAATTANKLCFWDNKAYSKECYPKLDSCPYAEQ